MVNKNIYEYFTNLLPAPYCLTRNLFLDGDSFEKKLGCVQGSMEMRELTLPNTLYMEKKRMSQTALEARLEWWKFMLLVSSVSGGVCGLVGMTLGLMSLLGFLNSYRLLDDLVTVMLVFAFPLIILAAHCLDKAYEVDKAITMEYFRGLER